MALADLRRSLRNFSDDVLPQGGAWRLLGVVLILYLLIVLGLGFYWNIEPDAFDVRTAARSQSDTEGELVTGAALTGTLIEIVETLLEKPGGFISNDRMPPGVLMDNMPNWEFGALVQSRDLARALRELFSRSQSQSREDADLANAEPRLHFQTDGWILPSSEGEYRTGLSHLDSYLERLVDPAVSDAQFYARSDNLRDWLGMVSTRLGSLSQRLSASVGQRRLNTDLAGDGSARQSTVAPAELDVQTPWTELDDVFFEARGAAWALIHFLRAAELDFAEVLKNKNAQVSLQQIVRELEATQGAIWSPVILNGTGFGLLANHSLVMASYIARANAGVIELRNLLAQG